MPSKNNPNKPKRRGGSGQRQTKQQSQAHKIAALEVFTETSKKELGTAIAASAAKHCTLPRGGGVIHGSGGINRKRERKEERRRKGMEAKVKELEQRQNALLAMVEGEKMEIDGAAETKKNAKKSKATTTDNVDKMEIE